MFYGDECVMGFGWIVPLVFFALMVFCMFRMGGSGGMCGFSESRRHRRETRRHEMGQGNRPLRPGDEGL